MVPLRRKGYFGDHPHRLKPPFWEAARIGDAAEGKRASHHFALPVNSFD